MKPEDIQKLLGGYATGTLTPEEREALFEAALNDQQLFEALAKEQPLHDLLQDPAARAQVLAAIEDRPRPWWQFANRWMLAGTMAAACLAVAAGIYFGRPKPAPKRVLVAVLQDRPPAQPVPLSDDSLRKVTPSAPPAAPDAEPLKKAPTPAAPADQPAERLKQVTTSGRLSAPAASVKPRDLEEQRPARRQDEPVLQAETSAPKPVKALAAPAANALVPQAAAPLAPPSPPSVPSSTQTVEVTASASVLDARKADLVVNSNGQPSVALPDQNARTLFYSAQGLAGTQFMPSPQQSQMQSGAQRGAIGGLAGALLVPNPGVKWTVLRKQPNGLFDQVAPDQIKAGDTIKLRLFPNDDGFLSVFDAGNPLVSNALAKRLEPLETPEITSRAGKKDLTVLLARQAQPVQLAKDAKKRTKAAAVFRTVATDQLTETDRGERAVYEVKTGNNPFAPILLKITLNFQ